MSGWLRNIARHDRKYTCQRRVRLEDRAVLPGRYFLRAFQDKDRRCVMKPRSLDPWDPAERVFALPTRLLLYHADKLAKILFYSDKIVERFHNTIQVIDLL
jgi:hypothetical protein